MKMECDVIRDLLPLYTEQMLCTKSKELVEEHLAECNICSRTYKEMSIKVPEMVYDKKPADCFRKYMKRERRIAWIKAFLSALLILILGLAAIFVIPTGFLGTLTLPLWISHTIEGGENYSKDKLEGNSGFLIFPDKPDTEEIQEFYYSNREGIFDGDIQVYLKCSYTPEEYEKECQRLSQLYVSCQGKRNDVRCNEEDYMMPAYETIQGVDHTYEYALTDDKEGTIEYVFLQFISPENIVFEEEKLPYGYERDRSVDKSLTRYNMYAFPAEEGNYDEGYVTVYQ